MKQSATDHPNCHSRQHEARFPLVCALARFPSQHLPQSLDRNWACNKLPLTIEGGMKIVFMGTPNFSVPSLRALADAGHDIVAVYSQPPRRAGRGKALTPTPVHVAAQAMGIPVHTPSSLKGDREQASFAAHHADVAVVAAYGLILPRAVLAAPKYGCINVHASLLPRWRGAAPIQRAILTGDTETGVTIMQMDVGLDTGPMLADSRTLVARKTVGQLTEELALLGADLLLRVLADLPAYPARPQPTNGVTYAAKIDKTEAQLDFLISAAQVERQIRAFHPTAYFELNGERVRVLEADVSTPDHTHATPATTLDEALAIACNPGAIRPKLVQRAGGKVMATSEFLRGFAIPAGTKLG